MIFAIRPRHSRTQPPRWPMIIAFLLHISFVIWLVYAGKNLPTQSAEDLPEAVELWEGSAIQPKEISAAKTRPALKIHENTPTVENNHTAKPDIVLPSKKPAKPIKKAPNSDRTSELTATKKHTNKLIKNQLKKTLNPIDALDLPPTNAKGKHGRGNAEHSQVGAKTGAANGVQAGHGVDLSAYKQEVIRRVRSFAKAPPDTKGSPRVTISVRLDPSMRVIGVSLFKSSGDSAYDQAVLQGVRSVESFPPRPSGVDMARFRPMILTISLPKS